MRKPTRDRRARDAQEVSMGLRVTALEETSSQDSRTRSLPRQPAYAHPQPGKDVSEEQIA